MGLVFFVLILGGFIGLMVYVAIGANRTGARLHRIIKAADPKEKKP